MTEDGQAKNEGDPIARAAYHDVDHGIWIAKALNEKHELGAHPDTVLQVGQKIGVSIHIARQKQAITDTIEAGKDRRTPQPQKPPASDVPVCPECGGDMWDNRAKKATGEFKAKAPDFKCKDENCAAVIWPPKDGEGDAPTLPF